MVDRQQRFASLADYVERTGLKKLHVAKELGISRYQMSALLYPERYGPAVDEVLLDKIAGLLNQPPAYVRRLYPEAA
jgi:hypothetical protein